MPPPASHAPLGRAGFEQLLKALRAAVVEAQAPLLMPAVQARKYVGMSKSAWYRAASAGLIPRAVFVEGSGDRYRRGDLDAFVARLKPRRPRRAPGKAADGDGV